METITLTTPIATLVVTLFAGYLPVVNLDAATVTNAPARAAVELKSAQPSQRAVVFYYPWYGNPATDGRYANWNHQVAVRNEPPRSFRAAMTSARTSTPAWGATVSMIP